ncbi:hypothetical protein WKK05_40415 (plasmid) [Nostoc sp. UHCC 0302]|uniref:hypothetical protein n=1 Tax=Nostoc sp. UHCC 0302 TaxID=3134896 RepID=UPI00311CE0AB
MLTPRFPMDLRQLIKKTEKPIRKKIDPTPSPAEATEIPEIQDIPEPVIEPTPSAYIEASESDYIPEYYRPLRSVGNSGWQPSDVWRDIRVDDFCG